MSISMERLQSLDLDELAELFRQGQSLTHLGKTLKIHANDLGQTLRRHLGPDQYEAILVKNRQSFAARAAQTRRLHKLLRKGQPIPPELRHIIYPEAQTSEAKNPEELTAE